MPSGAQSSPRNQLHLLVTGVSPKNVNPTTRIVQMPAQVREAQIAVLAKHHTIRTHPSAASLEGHSIEQLPIRT